jgi:tRNA (Thr-GGU) A37 N-methylase
VESAIQLEPHFEDHSLTGLTDFFHVEVVYFFDLHFRRWLS